MGVSIHYSGQLASQSTLSELLQEVRTLADEARWSFNDIAPAVFHLPNRTPVRAQGLLLQIHPDCEPLNLIFDENGRLVNFLYLIGNAVDPASQTTEPAEPRRIIVLDGNGVVEKTENDLADYHEIGLWWASTKTQAAGPAAHIALCKLLRYLEAKYFERLEVNDETQYWETGEVERLIECMRIVDFALDRLSGFLETRHYQTASEKFTETLLDDLLNFCKQIQKDLPHKRPLE